MVLYHCSGSAQYEVGSPALTSDQWLTVKANAVRLLRGRSATEAADFLEVYPFVLANGTNGFGDEFLMLHANLPMNDFLRLSEWHHASDNRYIPMSAANA